MICLCITLIGNLLYWMLNHVLLFSSEASIICIIEMPRYWTIFTSTDIWFVIKHSIFKQRPVPPSYLSPQALYSMINMLFFDKQFNPPNLGNSKSSLLKCDFSSKHWHLLDVVLKIGHYTREFTLVAIWGNSPLTYMYYMSLQIILLLHFYAFQTIFNTFFIIHC